MRPTDPVIPAPRYAYDLDKLCFKPSPKGEWVRFKDHEAEIAALTAALDEATACSVCNGHPPDGGCHCGTPGKWEGNVTPGRRHDVMCKLSPASRALCERLFGGAK